ncbi:inovirus-type Gp2 protein [Escherichia coli]|nr:inovirus-type Gp2 protein [Escherichia coli]MBA8155850.1 inovirus-type Gp2 protein [Escherichia coli]MBB7231313.1 inovirus-type Gp2 protein [Escherichia coli]QMC47920.1 inovirus-type Gp2 protein [Escherichia coli]QMC48079.1 inovirus-type Gp2 protein [Escherichia coli]
MGGILISNAVTRHYDNGRYSLINSKEYICNDIVFELNYEKDKNHSPIRKEIMDRFIDQICAMRTHYKKTFAFRFDLHTRNYIYVPEGNRLVSQLFTRLHGKFKAKNWNKQPIKNSANGWVREIGDKEEKLHYHCWLALPYFQVRKPGFNDSGIFGLINSIWGELTGGNGYTYLCDGRYVIDRDDDEALKAFITQVSYMAKSRGKFSTGDGHRIFSASRLARKI